MNKKHAHVSALRRQLDRLEGRLEGLYRTSRRFSWLRLLIAVASLLAAGIGLTLVGWWLAAICLAIGGLAFGLAVYAHRRIESAIERYKLWRQIKQGHVARAELDWERIPATFRHRARSGHPFESDLDLIGGRSLHRLLDSAVSYEGSQRLRLWLAAPVPEPAEITRRQSLARELLPRSLFRDKLSLYARAAVGAPKTWEAQNLIEWLDRHSGGGATGRWLGVLALLSALNIALLLANLAGLFPPLWAFSWALYLGLMLLTAGSTGEDWSQAQALQDALAELRAVFGHLETFSYRDTPNLRALCAPFLEQRYQPSRYLARIGGIVAAMSVRGNPLVWFAFNAFVPWDLFFAHQLDRAKNAIAARAPAWMDVWFELEALSALANLAYLNPGYPFPQILAAGEGDRQPVLRAEGLGHPLIPDRERVVNDFEAPALGQVTIITGSNMSGKSVFLKTVGLNLALAFAGGPVAADSLETVPFRLFTSIEIADSVTDGISYFYAEVKRLKALLEELEGDRRFPLLFCIDEIFRGTNNLERLAGSRAYVRALAGRQGLGFVATHDLELARLADELPRVLNYHFRDQIHGGRMVFDYTLRPGPCPTTNALTIMALEGLPVPAEQGEAHSLDTSQQADSAPSGGSR